jgi:hypothetical protein
MKTEDRRVMGSCYPNDISRNRTDPRQFAERSTHDPLHALALSLKADVGRSILIV